MTRGTLDYSVRRKGVAAPGSLTDEPIAGFYQLRRGAGAVYRPVAIWYGPPLDPETSEPLDRSWRWQVLFCGRFIWDYSLVWPVCGGQPIDRAEYEYLLERVLYAREHDPNDPFGKPSGWIDWDSATPPTF